jgi:hypothetical protein
VAWESFRTVATAAPWALSPWAAAQVRQLDLAGQPAAIIGPPSSA